MQPGPTIGRIVIYRSRTGDYDVPAIVNCTEDTLNAKGVEAGHVPDLVGQQHVHLTVFTPGKPGMRGSAEDFEVLPEGGHEALSENVAGCYQEWDIPPADDYQNPGPGTWRWPQIGGGDGTASGEPAGEVGAIPADAPRYSRDDLGKLKFKQYRIRRTLEVAPVKGPCIVSTQAGALPFPEGWEGYIALHPDGDPFVITEEQMEDYEPVKKK